MVAKDIREFLNALREKGKHITIETAATVPPDGIACDLASLSPKLSNSMPKPGEIADGWIERHEARRLQPEVIAAWIDSYPFQLKFVVSKAADLAEIQAIVAGLPSEIPPEKVLLMPEGADVGTIRGRDETLIDLCKRYGYRFCNRLHIELFGNKPGT